MVVAERFLGVLSAVCDVSSRVMVVICETSADAAHRLMHATSHDASADVIVDESDFLSDALSGMLRSAQHEYPRVRMTVLDIASQRSDLGSVSDAVQKELVFGYHANVELEVAYRGGRRLVKRYLEVAELGAPEFSAPRREWSAAGAYIITGGLGALGLLTARVLVNLGAKR